MRRLVALTLLLAACASQPATASYAIILDRSVSAHAASIRSALSAKLTNADYIDTLLPADKHEAIVSIQRTESGFAYDIYRGEQLLRHGAARTPERLADHIARDLRRL